MKFFFFLIVGWILGVATTLASAYFFVSINVDSLIQIIQQSTVGQDRNIPPEVQTQEDMQKWLETKKTEVQTTIETKIRESITSLLP